MTHRSPDVHRWPVVSLCAVLLLASCASTHWRDAEPGSHESALPRVDFSIVREAGPNERVGATQAVDGKAYVLQETQYFRISEARLGTDGLGHAGLLFDVHPDSASRFNDWTAQNISRTMGMSIEGELVWVGPLTTPARGEFMISDAAGAKLSPRMEKLMQRFNGSAGSDE